MAVCSRRRSQQGHGLTQELTVVRKILSRLETKLLENDADRFSREEDEALRLALQRIGDSRLTRLMLDYAVCVRGLTAPMASRAWKQELAEEVEEVHWRALSRLDRLERLAGSPLGRLWLGLLACVRRALHQPPHAHRVPSPEENGKLQ